MDFKCSFRLQVRTADSEVLPGEVVGLKAFKMSKFVVAKRLANIFNIKPVVRRASLPSNWRPSGGLALRILMGGRRI